MTSRNLASDIQKSFCNVSSLNVDVASPRSFREMNRSENREKSNRRKSRLVTLLSQQKNLVYLKINEARNAENLDEVKKLLDTEKQLRRLIQAVKENNYLLMNNE